MSICCKAAFLYMFFSIFLWLTNGHLRSNSLMCHSSFCITLLFSLIHCDHLEWNCCSLFLGLLQALRCIFRVYALCILSPQHYQTCLYSPLLYRKAQSFEESRSVFLFRPKQPHIRMCFSSTWPLCTSASSVTKFFLQLSKSPHKLQLIVIDSENTTVNYSSFFFLLAWKDMVEAECLQLFTAWASCYISRVCVFRATASIQPVFLAPTHLRKVL